MVRIELRCMSKDVTFGQLSLDSLRLFLQGPGPAVHELYELIHNNTLEVAVASSPRDAAPVLLDRRKYPPGRVRTRRGDRCPTRLRSFLGYRLLSEFFAFPRKFLFFDLAGLGGKTLSRVGNKLEMFLYLNRTIVGSGTQRQCGHVPAGLHADRQSISAAGRADRVDAHADCIPGRSRTNAVQWRPRFIQSTESRPLRKGSRTSTLPFYSFKHGADAARQHKFWLRVAQTRGVRRG